MFRTQRTEPDIEHVAGAAEVDRRERLQSVAPTPSTIPSRCGRPAEQQAFGAEPAREQTEHQRRKGLQDPQAAEQLQIERILRRQEQDEGERADLTTSEAILATAASPAWLMPGLT